MGNHLNGGGRARFELGEVIEISRGHLDGGAEGKEVGRARQDESDRDNVLQSGKSKHQF